MGRRKGPVLLNVAEALGVKYEEYSTANTGNNSVGGIVWIGQTFTPSVGHRVRAIKIKIFKAGSPGTVTVSLKATAAGLPTGADLGVDTMDGDTLGGSPGTWQTFVMPAVVVQPSVEYAIVVRCAGAINTLRWILDGNNGYANGSKVSSPDSGSSWSDDPTEDLYFEEWS